MAYIKTASVYEASKVRLLEYEKEIRRLEYDGLPIPPKIRARAHELACQVVIWEWDVKPVGTKASVQVDVNVTPMDLLAAARANNSSRTPDPGPQLSVSAKSTEHMGHLDLSLPARNQGVLNNPDVVP